MKVIRPFIVNDAALVSSNVPENDYTLWDSGAPFDLGNRAIYVDADIHWVIESLQNANLNHIPSGLSTDTWWLKVGETNRWKMFDNSVQAQTTRVDDISVALQVSEIINSAVLLNVSAASVRIVMTDNSIVSPRTNLLTYSEQLDNSVWGRLGISSIVPAAASAPNGSNTAEKIILSGVADPNLGQVYDLGTAIATRTFTFSIWAWTDAGQPTFSQLFIYDSSVIHVSNINITLTTTPTRYSITYTFPVGTIGNAFTVRLDPVDAAISGDYLYAWGAQLEEGTEATSYIATTSAPVTVYGDGVVYDKTYSLVSDSGITDWYSYFFEPIVRITDFSVTDLPTYLNTTVEVILTNTDSTAAIGGLILGLQKNIGESQYGLTTGITDYSVKQQDDFGNYTILERSYRNRAEVSIFMQNSAITEVQNILSALRAIPSVYIGADEYSNTIIYGFYKDFNINIAYPTHSICQISLEGLT